MCVRVCVGGGGVGGGSWKHCHTTIYLLINFSVCVWGWGGGEEKHCHTTIYISSNKFLCVCMWWGGGALLSQVINYKNGILINK